MATPPDLINLPPVPIKEFPSGIISALNNFITQTVSALTGTPRVVIRNIVIDLRNVAAVADAFPINISGVPPSAVMVGGVFSSNANVVPTGAITIAWQPTATGISLNQVSGVILGSNQTLRLVWLYV